MSFFLSPKPDCRTSRSRNVSEVPQSCLALMLDDVEVQFRREMGQDNAASFATMRAVDRRRLPSKECPRSVAGLTLNEVTVQDVHGLVGLTVPMGRDLATWTDAGQHSHGTRIFTSIQDFHLDSGKVERSPLDLLDLPLAMMVWNMMFSISRKHGDRQTTLNT